MAWVSNQYGYFWRIDGTNGNDSIQGEIHLKEYLGSDANNIIFTYDGDDTVHAGNGFDIVYGGKDKDVFYGEDGTDKLYGYDGDDRLYGGNGEDSLIGGAGNDQLFGGDDTDRLWGGSGDDILSGQDGDDLLYGGNDNDRLSGGEGRDALFGESGDDQLSGGQGSDSLYGGGGTNTLYYGGSDAAVFINLETHDATGGHATGDSFTNIQNITGSRFSDTLIGDAGANVLNGGFKGNDTLEAAGGDDILIGGLGNDLMDGGTGIDTVSYADLDYTYFNQGLTIDLGNGYAATLDTHSPLYQYDTLASIENAVGSDYGDELFGSSGANRLDGDDGNDFLDGRNGDDILNGGSGVDTFVFNHGSNSQYPNAPAQQDVIEDFEINVDKIDLSNTYIGNWNDLYNARDKGQRYLDDGDGMYQDGHDVVIQTSDVDTVRLENVNINQLDQNDFIF